MVLRDKVYITSYTNSSVISTRKWNCNKYQWSKTSERLSKLKIEEHLLNKIEGQELKEESDHDNKGKTFDFVVESHSNSKKTLETNSSFYVK